jgi:flagellar biosynthesis/type III secretory pathway protein FliH
LQRLEEATQQGIEQGIERGIERGAERERRNMVETLMLMRFGEIDPHLATIVSSLMALPPAEFTPLLMQLSRQELLARFGII